MFDFNNDSDNDSEIVFRDMITLALMGITVAAILLILHINPPTKKVTEQVKSPGAIIVELIWPSSLDVDMDLWVKGPGDSPVGYFRKNGKLFNLLRDDLGKAFDVTNMNYENAYSRGIAPGKYIVNVHYYATKESPALKIPVQVVVSVRNPKRPDSRPTQILNKTIDFYNVSEEITFFRFDLTSEGELVKGSVDQFQQIISNLVRRGGS